MSNTIKKIGKTKGYALVMVGLVLGLLQALATIPSGGGYLYLVMLGGLLGGLGFIIVALRNKFSKKVKIGAIIAAIILFIAMILSFVQINIFNQATGDMVELKQSTQDINAQNWMDKKHNALESMRGLINNFVVGIFLLALATGLIAISVVFPPIMGNDRKKFIMLIPFILAVLAILVAILMTNYYFSDFRGVLDNLEVATTQSDYESVVLKIDKLSVQEMTMGSRLGGIFNFIAIIMAIIFSFVVTIELGQEQVGIPQLPKGPSYSP